MPGAEGRGARSGATLRAALLASAIASLSGWLAFGITGWHIAPAYAELAPAPSREVAGKCRALAYKAYPRERPGRSPGSGARYELFRDCVDRGGNIDPATSPAVQFKPPAPQLGPPANTGPASSPAAPAPAPPQP
jgi:hypothetical protein